MRRLRSDSPKFLNCNSNLIFIIATLGPRPKRHCSARFALGRARPPREQRALCGSQSAREWQPVGIGNDATKATLPILVVMRARLDRQWTIIPGSLGCAFR